MEFNPNLKFNSQLIDVKVGKNMWDFLFTLEQDHLDLVAEMRVKLKKNNYFNNFHPEIYILRRIDPLSIQKNITKY